MQTATPSIDLAVAHHIRELPSQSQVIAKHIFSAGGKRLRPLLVLWSGWAFGCTSKELYTIGAALEILHAATLLHDDIMDNADTRRSKPTAHTQYDATRVILAGDAMLAKSLCLVSAFDMPLLTKLLSEAALQTAEGQIAEFENTKNTAISYENYLDAITGKTAWILKTACQMGAIYAGASKEQSDAMATYGLELGIAFQLVDDTLDFSPSEETGKPYGGDLLEGKMTPPLLYYLASLQGSEKETFISQFEKGTFSSEDITRIAEQLHTQGFIQKTLNLAQEHIDKALAAMATIPESFEKELLKKAATYIITRTK